MKLERTEENLTPESLQIDGTMFIYKITALINANVYVVAKSDLGLLLYDLRGNYYASIMHIANKRFDIGKVVLGDAEKFTRKFEDFKIVKSK